MLLIVAIHDRAMLLNVANRS